MARGRTRHVLRIALGMVAIDLATAGGALALPPEENDNWIELGAWANSDDSFKFGDYTGLEQKGWDVLANFDILRRPVWDSGDTRWWRVQGQNLGLESRYARGDFGYQGLFHLWFQYEEIPKFLTDTTKMVFTGRGTELLQLRPSWVPSQTTPGFLALNPNLRNLDVDLLRQNLRTGFGLDLPADLEWVGDYWYQSKQGRQLTGAAIGNTGGNPRASIIPEPVDYRTNDAQTSVRWNGKKAQLEVGYQYSQFDDDNSSLTWQNPFSLVSGWDAGGYPTGFGRLATPPNNNFQQISFAGGVDLPFNTRISTDTAFGWMRQNDDLLPFTVNPAIDAPIPLPRGSGDAQIDTTNSMLRIASRPIEHLRIDAGFRYDDRDNKTTRDAWSYVAGDSLDQEGITSDRVRFNTPNSYQLIEGHVETGYEIFEGTELAAGYRRQNIKRSYTEVAETGENTFEGVLRSRPVSWLQIRTEGAYSDRNGTQYMYQAPIFQGFTPQHIATIAPRDLFENNPLLRKLTYADRERSSVVGRIDLLPLETFSMGFDGSWIHDNYDQTILGLTNREALSVTADASWTPVDILTTYAWFTYENAKSDVNGLSFSNTVQAFDPSRDWFEHDKDDIYSFGVGAELHLFQDRVRLRADYEYSMANTNIDIRTGPALTPPGSSFPDIESRLNDFTLSAEYQIRPNISVRFMYSLEDLLVKDWAYGVLPTAMNQVLGLGEQNPDYRDHLFGFAIRYQFH